MLSRLFNALCSFEKLYFPSDVRAAAFSVIAPIINGVLRRFPIYNRAFQNPSSYISAAPLLFDPISNVKFARISAMIPSHAPRAIQGSFPTDVDFVKLSGGTASKDGNE